MNFKIIATDFDGTLCENKWPDIGAPNYEVIDYLIEQRRCGCKIVLWTCRVGDELTNAVAWCRDRDLEFDAVNRNVKEVVELFGSDTRKIFANEYIDDLMNARFDLPYHVGKVNKKEMGQTDEWIYSPLGGVDAVHNKLFEAVEKALGFKLFIWQKAYIAHGEFRRYGATTAEILRDLLNVSKPPLDYSRPPVNNMARFYRDETREIKRKLYDSGIPTRPVFFSLSDKVSWNATVKDLGYDISPTVTSGLSPNAIRYLFGYPALEEYPKFRSQYLGEPIKDNKDEG